MPWWYFGALALYGVFNVADILAGGQRNGWFPWPVDLALSAAIAVGGSWGAVVRRRARRAGSGPR